MANTFPFITRIAFVFACVKYQNIKMRTVFNFLLFLSEVSDPFVILNHLVCFIVSQIFWLSERKRQNGIQLQICQKKHVWFVLVIRRQHIWQTIRTSICVFSVSFGLTLPQKRSDLDGKMESWRGWLFDDILWYCC